MYFSTILQSDQSWNLIMGCQHGCVDGVMMKFRRMTKKIFCMWPSGPKSTGPQRDPVIYQAILTETHVITELKFSDDMQHVCQAAWHACS